MKFLLCSLVLAITLSLCACPPGTKGLATASDAISHALSNAQVAAKQALANGTITPQDEQEFETYLVKASQTGLELDKAIRAGESAQTVSQKTNVFMDAFNSLNTAGLIGIKNPNLRLAISTILTGAESSVAIISATLGK